VGILNGTYNDKNKETFEGMILYVRIEFWVVKFI